MCTCLFLCDYVHLSTGAPKALGIRFSGSRVTGSCESRVMPVRKEDCVLGKSSECS